MLAKCALTYENISIGIFDKTRNFTLIKEKVKLFLRYINDIFFLSAGSENYMQ